MDVRVVGETLRFEDWRFDRRTRLLFRQDAAGAWTPVSIGSRALEILALLLERPGTVVSREAIMDAVWPNTAVEANNLTVQIAALRRALDHNRTGGTCIRTVPGRGYRFVVPVHPDEDSPPPRQDPHINGSASTDVLPAEPGGCRAVTASTTASSAGVSLGFGRFVRRLYGVRFVALLTGSCLAIAALLLLGLSHSSWLVGRPAPPRLSLVVLPFENLSGDPKDAYLADGITDDLTSDLSLFPGAFVIARETAYTYDKKPADVRTIGDALGVRYVLEGSVRRIESTIRVNVQLTSAENGAHLWSDRFDEQITELAAGQEQIVTRMRAGLGISLVEIEKARSLRERPTNPDAFDLILRARALYNQPPSLQRHLEAQALFERALMLDPSSVSALSWVVLCLIERADTRDGWRYLENMQRAERLAAQARAIAPGARETLGATFQWLRSIDRCQEAIPVAEQIIQRFPNYALGYAYLGSCKLITGHAEEDLPLEAKAMQINPRDPNLFLRYRRLGFASLLLGRDKDAITFLKQSLAIQGL
jgi:TolB-like protein/DNA-binding winged helix-turn-helix (wHTH) protein